jgi:hypothetical protein
LSRNLMLRTRKVQCEQMFHSLSLCVNAMQKDKIQHPNIQFLGTYLKVSSHYENSSVFKILVNYIVKLLENKGRQTSRKVLQCLYYIERFCFVWTQKFRVDTEVSCGHRGFAWTQKFRVDTVVSCGHRSFVWTQKFRVDTEVSCGHRSFVWAQRFRVDTEVSCGHRGFVWKQRFRVDTEVSCGHRSLVVF